jgi:hypothetical protein
VFEMAENLGAPSRVVRELAGLTGRSDAEIKLIVGVALATVAAAVAIQVAKILVDLELPSSR